jgi:hypothetical protein
VAIQPQLKHKTIMGDKSPKAVQKQSKQKAKTTAKKPAPAPAKPKK